MHLSAEKQLGKHCRVRGGSRPHPSVSGGTVNLTFNAVVDTIALVAPSLVVADADHLVGLTDQLPSENMQPPMGVLLSPSISAAACRPDLLARHRLPEQHSVCPRDKLSRNARDENLVIVE